MFRQCCGDEKKPVQKAAKGIFSNGMAWASVEYIQVEEKKEALSSDDDDKKVALIIPGGPGNFPPSAPDAFSKLLDPLMVPPHNYKMITVTRRRNMPRGHTAADMAQDYANCIQSEFAGGKVDLIVGASYGGMIALYMAANHAHRFHHIVVHVAASRVVNPAYDVGFARALSERRYWAAGSQMAQGLLDNWKSGPTFCKSCLGGSAVSIMAAAGAFEEHFYNDVLVEGEEEAVFDARPILPQIRVPVLLLSGDQDLYFPKDIVLETQSLIPNCKVKWYEGKGHLGAALDKRVPMDILEFVAENTTK